MKAVPAANNVQPVRACYMPNVNDKRLHLDGSLGDVDVLLPQGAHEGRIIEISRGDNSANRVQIQAENGEIDGRKYMQLKTCSCHRRAKLRKTGNGWTLMEKIYILY